MSEYITELSTKYGMPYDKVESLVREVVDCLEADLPASVKSQVECSAAELLEEKLMKENGVFQYP